MQTFVSYWSLVNHPFQRQGKNKGSTKKGLVLVVESKSRRVLPPIGETTITWNQQSCLLTFVHFPTLRHNFPILTLSSLTLHSLWPFPPTPTSDGLSTVSSQRLHLLLLSTINKQSSSLPKAKRIIYKEERPSTSRRPSIQKVPTTAWPVHFFLSHSLYGPPKSELVIYHSIQSGPSQLQAVRGSAIS